MLEKPDENTLVFEIINVDVSFANALRRILLSEIPTMAFEKIYLYQNTGIIHDEILSHRIGLIPIDVDARLMDDIDETVPAADQLTDRTVLVFTLNVECEKPSKQDEKPGKKKDGGDEDEMDADAAKPTLLTPPRSSLPVPQPPLYTQSVYSGDLQWVPQGDQAEFIPNCKVLHDDILLAKLRPGQAIALEAHAFKGTDHAKFSAVATASYRLASRILLRRDIYDDLAEELVHVYEPGVFDLQTAPDGRKKAVVVNPYACTMSRNYMRNPQLKEAIEIRRVPNHFIFSVESLGAYPPAVLVAEALQVLQNKCNRLHTLIDEKTTTT